MEVIKTGTKKVAPKILIYGVEGIGKSTFGADAPNPVFIQTEDGLSDIETNALPVVTKYKEFETQLDWVLQSEEANAFQTIVIDSLDWLERILCEHIAYKNGVKTLQEIGWGKGSNFLADEVFTILRKLSDYNSRGKGVILIAHAKIEAFKDPTGDAYDRYSPNLGKKTSPIYREWAHDVLFANYKSMKKSTEDGRTIAIKAERLLFASDRPSHIAKTRSGIPDELPFSWKSYITARKQAREAKTTTLTGAENNG